MTSHTDRGRRRFLRDSLLTVPVVLAGSSLPWRALAAVENPPALSDYQPLYFKPEEWRFLLAACERLIPPDEEGPSALEANVPIFIDWQMESDFGHAADWYMEGPFFADASPLLGYQTNATPREYYRRGIEAVDKHCQQTAQRDFAQLSEADQTALLEQMENDEIDMGDLSSAQFFAFLLENTKEGYFADPMYGGNKHMAAWKMIGFPGARASYLEWADQHDRAYPLGPVSIKGERG